MYGLQHTYNNALEWCIELTHHLTIEYHMYGLPHTYNNALVCVHALKLWLKGQLVSMRLQHTHNYALVWLATCAIEFTCVHAIELTFFACMDCRMRLPFKKGT